MMTRFDAYRAAVLAALLAAAPAFANQVTELSAHGSYSLNGQPAVLLQSNLPLDPVDVLDFPGTGDNTAGLHSYGSSTGFFGTRSSGTGIYDVSSSFRIVETVTNDTGGAVSATLNFNISPGVIMNNIGSPLTGNQFVSSGLHFLVSSNGSTVYASDATLTTTATGTIFSATGDTSLYNGSGLYYTINNTALSVSLGTLGVGQSLTLSYDLSSFATGYSVPGGPQVTPATSYFVPGQYKVVPPPALRWKDMDRQVVVSDPGFTPPHTVFVPPLTLPPGVSQSHASVGDPFDINLKGLPVFSGKAGGLGAAYVLFEPTDATVPEPASWALMVAGFGLTGATLRRRRRALV